MYEYASEKAQESQDNLELSFSDNAAQKFLDLMNSLHEQYNNEQNN